MSDSPDPAVPPETMTVGLQPMDSLMDACGLTNHEVVAAAAGSGLTHKVVQKARKGRHLTARAQKKVLAAVNAARKSHDLPAVTLDALFNYRGR